MQSFNESIIQNENETIQEQQDLQQYHSENESILG